MQRRRARRDRLRARECANLARIREVRDAGEERRARFIAVNARVGMSGRSRPCDTLEEARHMLDVWAGWAGLRSEAMQLTMF